MNFQREDGIPREICSPDHISYRKFGLCSSRNKSPERNPNPSQEIWDFPRKFGRDPIPLRIPLKFPREIQLYNSPQKFPRKTPEGNWIPLKFPREIQLIPLRSFLGKLLRGIGSLSNFLGNSVPPGPNSLATLKRGIWSLGSNVRRSNVQWQYIQNVIYSLAW